MADLPTPLRPFARYGEVCARLRSLYAAKAAITTAASKRQFYNAVNLSVQYSQPFIEATDENHMAVQETHWTGPK